MGPPSFFFTIAPCIADSEICLKFLNFPTFRYKIKQSTHEQRSIWSAKNPVASAKAFHCIMDALVPLLLVYLPGTQNILSQLTACCRLTTIVVIPYLQDLKRILGVGQNALVYPRHSMVFMRLKDVEHCTCMPLFKLY